VTVGVTDMVRLADAVTDELSVADTDGVIVPLADTV
jgi:hypothetical protein